MSENRPLPLLKPVDLPTTSISVVNDNILIDYRKPMRFIQLSLPKAREMILHLRKAANALEQKQRGNDVRRVHPKRRRASSKKHR